MPAINPEEREGEFIPPEKAQERGFWGTPVNEYPNERFTANEVTKYNPGGWAGTEEAPQHETQDGEAKRANEGEPKRAARKSEGDK